MAERKQILMERADLGKAVHRMAREIVEKCAAPGELVLIGIRSRGVHLARRLARKIEESEKLAPPVVAIDVTPYRDDRSTERGGTLGDPIEISATLDDKTVVLIDDVIFRGRTIRAAMEAVERSGRPKRIVVAALIDRGARELPIRADIVGKNIDAGAGQRVNVHLEEADGIDQVALAEWQEKK